MGVRRTLARPPARSGRPSRPRPPCRLPAPEPHRPHPPVRGPRWIARGARAAAAGERGRWSLRAASWRAGGPTTSPRQRCPPHRFPRAQGGFLGGSLAVIAAAARMTRHALQPAQRAVPVQCRGARHAAVLVGLHSVCSRWRRVGLLAEGRSTKARGEPQPFLRSSRRRGSATRCATYDDDPERPAHADASHPRCVAKSHRTPPIRPLGEFFPHAQQVTADLPAMALPHPRCARTHAPAIARATPTATAPAALPRIARRCRVARRAGLRWRRRRASRQSA